MAHIGIGSNRITHWSLFQSPGTWIAIVRFVETLRLDAILKPMYGNFLRNGHSHREAGPVSPVSPGAVTSDHSVCDVCDHDRLPGQASYSWIGWDTSLARPSPRASNASTRTSTSSSSGGPGGPGDQQHIAHCRPPLIHWHGSSMAAHVDGLLVCDHVKRNLGR